MLRLLLCNSESSSAPVLLSHRIFRDSAVDCDVDTDDSDERGHGGNLFGHLIEGQSVNTSSTSTGSVPVPASWTTAGSAPKIAIPQVIYCHLVNLMDQRKYTRKRSSTAIPVVCQLLS